MSSASSGSLLIRNKFRIVTENQKAEIRKRLPAPKHYIVYHVAIQGQKDLDADMRRKTRAVGNSHWETVIGGRLSLNSNKLHSDINSKIATSTSKTEAEFTKDPKIRLKSRDIYTQKGFGDKKMLTPEHDGSAIGNEAADRTQEERYANEAWVRTNRAHRRMTVERHLAARRGDWASQAIG